MKKTMLGVAFAASMLAACESKEQKEMHAKLDPHLQQVTKTMRDTIIAIHNDPDRCVTTEQLAEKKQSIYDQWEVSLADSTRKNTVFKLDHGAVIAQDTVKHVEIYRPI